VKPGASWMKQQKIVEDKTAVATAGSDGSGGMPSSFAVACRVICKI
jgi:hypothetical protein